MERSASGPTWAIATPHEEATRAGAAAFEGGGNAVDAALRAATVLAVVYPHMCGVGGDLFALVQRPDGETLAVSSSGRAPAAADAAGAGHAMPIRGPVPITVPGAVAGWRAVHGTGAVLPWDRAFSRAIELAIDGVPIARSLAATLAAPDESFGGDPGLSAIFFADGIPSPAGATVYQPALGATLAGIAEGGPEALYGGDIGRAYVRGLSGAGSPITIEDLSAHRALVLPPLAAAFRDLHVSVVPPNSQGFVLLEILALLERLRIGAEPRRLLHPGAGTPQRVRARQASRAHADARGRPRRARSGGGRGVDGRVRTTTDQRADPAPPDGRRLARGGGRGAALDPRAIGAVIGSADRHRSGRPRRGEALARVVAVSGHGGARPLRRARTRTADPGTVRRVRCRLGPSGGR